MEESRLKLYLERRSSLDIIRQYTHKTQTSSSGFVHSGLRLRPLTSSTLRLSPLASTTLRLSPHILPLRSRLPAGCNRSKRMLLRPQPCCFRSPTRLGPLGHFCSLPPSRSNIHFFDIHLPDPARSPPKRLPSSRTDVIRVNVDTKPSFFPSFPTHCWP